MNPILIYDGQCGFCKRCVVWLQTRTGRKIDYAPYQDIGKNYPEITKEEFERSVQFIELDKTIRSGAEAIFTALCFSSSINRIWWFIYRKLPGFAFISELSYRIVANHRNLFSKLTVFLWGKEPGPHSHWGTRQLFLRALGLIYFIAIVSLWVQIDGLIGSNGILPIKNFLELINENLGEGQFFQFPTLFWLNQNDFFINLVCIVGILFSVVSMIWPFSIALWISLWLIYLSLVVGGQTFLSFQWDILLLETGFLAIFLNPVNIIPKWSSREAPSKIVVWLHRWLLFRLMFASGAVKLVSGDESWSNLTALNYYYQTQPIPPWTAWYFHQFPVWFHKMSVTGMFFIELVVPFFIFAPRRVRLWAAIIILSFQILIITTGNYGYFNLLAIVLCLWFLDDSIWPIKKIKDFVLKINFLNHIKTITKKRNLTNWIFVPLCFVILINSTFLLSNATFRKSWHWPIWVTKLYESTSPFHIVNSYGLFQVMTKERPEIIIEGSNNASDWQAYIFKYKLVDLNQRPVFVAPHQPRLDWQMWFAALGNYQRNPWFVSFCVRIMQESKPVLDLLKENPFPNKPPQYLRARLFNYEFTNHSEKSTLENWWKREFKRPYLPLISQETAKQLAAQLKIEKK